MSQPLWHSIPYLCILLPLGSAAVTSVLKPLSLIHISEPTRPY